MKLVEKPRRTMKKFDVLATIRKVGLLPVLRASSLEEAVAVSRAIQAGGVSTLEVTMTVPGAVDLIQSLVRENNGSMLIGAGTVLDPETARVCILAGAAFIVSPSLNLKSIELCHRYGVAVIPGALTPTEVGQPGKREPTS
jgi:2-dehydro-3-deoxyphosphogluconate aldolase/(4S)-4-hydroxy-2-oxoglutarate aldolase